MEQQVLIAYVILLAINTAVFLLCAVQMIKFRRFYRNFNRVVNNVQSYLHYVMEDDPKEPETKRCPGDTGGGYSDEIVELDDEIPDVEILPRRKKHAAYGGQASGGTYTAMSREKKEEVLNSVLGELFS